MNSVADQPLSRSGRGVVYFTYGSRCVLQLLVSLYTLRKHYDGPVTVVIAPDRYGEAVKRSVEKLDANAVFMEGLASPEDRHRLFDASPFETTLIVDVDTVFCASIDPLWEPTERVGLLVTPFYSPPFGFDGTPDVKGDWARIDIVRTLEGHVDPELLERAVQRIIEKRTDINAGVMAVYRPKAEAFLADFGAHLAKVKGKKLPVADETLLNVLIERHDHVMAEEKWNCPADEMFRQTNLADAAIIHYFSDRAWAFRDQRLGRNALTWAGKKWYAAYFEARRELDLSQWRALDPRFDWRAEPVLANGPIIALKNRAREIHQIVRRFRHRPTRKNYWRGHW